MQARLVLFVAVVVACCGAVMATGEALDTIEDSNHDDRALLQVISSVRMRPTPVNQTGFLERPSSSMPSNSGKTCAQRIERFNELGAQEPFTAGWDPYFPPNLTSIAAPGTSCGDTAQGIAISCEMFNHWHTFQEVAAAQNTPFQVIGPKGIQMNDIGQGMLGDCYFLAALASTAEGQPQAIDDMFVERRLWQQNIFTTRWMLNGKETLVRVDNMVPARDWNLQMYFVSTSTTGEFWPVILEKAWAKIFSNYKAVEGGFWANAIAALTRAPVTVNYHYGNPSSTAVWNTLALATSLHQPMGADTSSNTPYGLASGHGYTVRSAFTSPTYGNVVAMYNPWRSDYYNGAIPNPSSTDGFFNMTFPEFYSATMRSSHAKLLPGYQLSFMSINSTAAVITSASAFWMRSDGPFYVSVNWPSWRLVQPCSAPNPTVVLNVAKSDDLTNYAAGSQMAPASLHSQFTAEVEENAGKYTVFAAVYFPDNTFINEISISVYGPSGVRFHRLDNPGATALAMYTNCTSNDFMVPNRGLYSTNFQQPVMGIPTLQSYNGQRFAWFNPSSGLWSVSSMSAYSPTAYPVSYYPPRLTPSQLSCGCSDTPGGINIGSTSVPCSNAVQPNNWYGSLHCTAPQYGSYVRNRCPVTCGVCSPSG